MLFYCFVQAHAEGFCFAALRRVSKSRAAVPLGTHQHDKIRDNFVTV
ncbi:hypothetical protein [uncultured Ruminococcus sp.]|nr:hypothetical protein [uncultured Ruminococcus sp.]